MLGDDIAWALPELRAAAESQMRDTCSITRAGTGTGPFNESTGQYDKPARTTVYTGKCRLQIKSVIASGSNADAGDRTGTVQELELQLPVDGTSTVTIGDIAEVTSSAMDDSLIGGKFTITARHEKSQATARRLRVSEVTA